ncbi:MAG: hypothetical protein DMF86_06895 [Acidobacteria bacterium]|nr:MAG: hypothetical protein DMF86_06895 [Acidobacteriota bacterium]
MTARTLARAAAALLAVAVVASVLAAAGVGGLLYFVIFAAALIPGLPLGFALFGSRHAGGWIAGALIGYFLTSLAIWVCIAARVPSALAFVVAWVVVAAAAWGASGVRPREGGVRPPLWTSRDTAALLLVLLLVPAIAGPPFARVGSRDADGNLRYRAYFTADFVWHTALTAELAKFASPPRNPYLANRPIHYYWTYFLLPAAVAATAPAPLADVQQALKVNAIGTALLFVSAIFLAAWTAVPRAAPVATAVALTIVASSAEGLYALARIWNRGAPWAVLRDLNVDALSSWWFGGLRVDGLQRCFWWVPQHSMAYALGLTALAVVNAAGSAAPAGAVAIAGVALAGAVACNPFVGGVFALVWGIAAAIDAFRSGDAAPRLIRCAIAIVPVGGAVAWCIGTQMVEGAGGTLQFGWLGAARRAPVFTFLLSLGPAVVPAIAGLLMASAVTRKAAPVLLLVVSIALLYLVRLNVDESWVGFRAGQMILVAAPALIARALVALGALRRAVPAIVVVTALLVGTPTTVIDEYNARDVNNFNMGVTFHWTVRITRAEEEALAWLRRTTPATAIVQMEPNVRERESWSLIPSFAQRRMAAGLPISLLDVPEYHEKTERVRSMYATTNAQEAWNIARSLHIDYVYIDSVERGGYSAGMAKFEDRQYFAPAFRNAEVSVYRVE